MTNGSVMVGACSVVEPSGAVVDPSVAGRFITGGGMKPTLGSVPEKLGNRSHLGSWNRSGGDAVVGGAVVVVGASAPVPSGASANATAPVPPMNSPPAATQATAE